MLDTPPVRLSGCSFPNLHAHCTLERKFPTLRAKSLVAFFFSLFPRVSARAPVSTISIGIRRNPVVNLNSPHLNLDHHLLNLHKPLLRRGLGRIQQVMGHVGAAPRVPTFGFLTSREMGNRNFGIWKFENQPPDPPRASAARKRSARTARCSSDNSRLLGSDAATASTFA